MRNPDRLYKFYDELRLYHMQYFPELRFGQFIADFDVWLRGEKNTGFYYIEEEEILRYMIDFIKYRIGIK